VKVPKYVIELQDFHTGSLFLSLAIDGDWYFQPQKAKYAISDHTLVCVSLSAQGRGMWMSLASNQSLSRSFNWPATGFSCNKSGQFMGFA